MTTLKKTVTLNPGQSKVVTFSVTPEEAKLYQVFVDGLQGSFTAVEVPALASLYGRVTDKDTGEAIVDVLVRLMKLDTVEEWQTQTNNDGHYQFNNLVSGDYGAWFIDPNDSYKIAEFGVTLTGGAKELNVEMERIPPPVKGYFKSFAINFPYPADVWYALWEAHGQIVHGGVVYLNQFVYFGQAYLTNGYLTVYSRLANENFQEIGRYGPYNVETRGHYTLNLTTGELVGGQIGQQAFNAEFGL